jgi:hypothetical protein
MAEVGRRAQIAYRGGSTVSVSYERDGKAIHVRPARTRAQALERLRCPKICLQHRVPLSSASGSRITVIREDIDLGNTDIMVSKERKSRPRSFESQPDRPLGRPPIHHYEICP